MLLTPSAAKPWLAPDVRNRPWPGHGAMMIRRREALAALVPAYGSWSRLALGALAWAGAAAGAVLLGRGVAAGGEGAATSTGIGVLVLATFLGAAVVATGSALARSVAAWLTLATAVRADGGRVDGTRDPDTRRAHESAVAEDRAAGARELWRPPLLPRTLACVLLAAAVVVLAVQAVQGWEEAAAAHAADDGRVAGLTQVLLAVVCRLTAGLTAGGLRRVRRARMHRVSHDEPPAAAPTGTLTPAATGTLTPAVGTGAIVVGGRAPGGTPVAPDPGGVAPPPATPAPVEPGQSPAPAAMPASTVASGEPDAATPAPSSPAEAATVRVRLSDGRELGPGVTLVGRAPRPRPDEQVDAVVAVADERVSKTHLTVRVEAGRVVVVDRASTNGTTVHPAYGGEHTLDPGEPYELTPGSGVVLGATTLTVSAPDDDVEHTVLRGTP